MLKQSLRIDPAGDLPRSHRKLTPLQRLAVAVIERAIDDATDGAHDAAHHAIEGGLDHWCALAGIDPQSATRATVERYGDALARGPRVRRRKQLSPGVL